MELPPGFKEDSMSNKVCILNKVLHGLKQPPRPSLGNWLKQ